MPDEHVVALAEGLWREGRRETEVVVRPLTGAAEVRLADLGPRATPAERGTELIAAATARRDSREVLTPDDARALSAGDRERLLLALHRLSFGPRVEAVARCPAVECGTPLELDLAVEELLQGGPEGVDQQVRGGEAGPEHEIEIATNGGRWRVRFRLPNGGDQEEAARMAAADPAAAAEGILRRCVLEVSGVDGRPVAVDEALPALSAPLAETLLRLDPRAETTLRLTCPACGAEATAMLDAGAFLLAELARGEDIFAEVDRLARAYHWTEAEILALPAQRRRRYLAHLAGP